MANRDTTITQVRNVNKQHRASLSALDQLAVWVTQHVGTMGFFLLILIWTLGWLGWNTLGPTEHRFDPYPAFVLWIFIANIVQIMLMPLIMIGQNLQNRHSELRAEADFEINKHSAKEVKMIITHLERQHETISKILKRLDNRSSK